MGRSLRLMVSLVALIGARAQAQPGEASGAEYDTGHESQGGPVASRSLEFPVVLSDGNTYTIAGTLSCRGSVRGKTLQVAVHGATYNSDYWDVPPLNGRRYSYARYMAERGFAVLAVDQLGTGASSHPPGDFLNLSEASLGLHQVLASLRRASNPSGVRFRRIVLVGHSNGSLTAIRAQAQFGDADGLVVTGWVHGSVPPVDPAEFEPLLAEPYVFVPPEIRTMLFYDPPNADPDMIAYDGETLNDVIPRAQFLDLLTAQFFDPSLSQSVDVDVPVLVQVGDLDFLMMFAPLEGETESYPSSPDLSLQQIAGSGHSLNTHFARQDSFRAIRRWITERF